MNRKSVIVTCAITGSLHTPSMSPRLPITPAQITAAAIDAAETGTSIIHLHARDRQDGRPTADPEVFRQFLPQIKAATDAVLNLTTGGAPGMSIATRLAPSMAAGVRRCSTPPWRPASTRCFPPAPALPPPSLR